MNQNYFEERKKELETEFGLLKDRTLNKILQTITEWQEDSRRIQTKYREVLNQEALSREKPAEKPAEEKKEKTKEETKEK